jgi:hypothetical protein
MRIVKAAGLIVAIVASPVYADPPDVINLDPDPKPAQVTAADVEPPTAWFYERYKIPENQLNLAQQAALEQLHRDMDSGYQPYVFCCGSIGDRDLIRWDHRVPVSGEIFNKYRLMPGQIIDAYTFQMIATEQVSSQNGQLQESKGLGGDFLDKLQK